MKQLYIVILLMCLALLTFTSCGISQEKYDTDINSKDATISELNQQIESLNTSMSEKEEQIKILTEKSNLKYFINRTEIQKWLDSVQKLGVSEDIVEWYQYALYYQKDALDKGFILSTAFYMIDEYTMDIWCEAVTEDGKVYYFNPDDCKLKESILEVPMVSPEVLKDKSLVKFQ